MNLNDNKLSYGATEAPAKGARRGFANAFAAAFCFALGFAVAHVGPSATQSLRGGALYNKEHHREEEASHGSGPDYIHTPDTQTAFPTSSDYDICHDYAKPASPGAVATSGCSGALAAGDEVVFQGLAAGRALNGKTGEITTVRPNGDLFVKIDDREELVAGSQAKRTGCSEPTHLIGAIQTPDTQETHLVGRIGTGSTPHEEMPGSEGGMDMPGRMGMEGGEGGGLEHVGQAGHAMYGY
jgi:hypothetical protein